jgi:hypothetical protein
MGDSKGDVTDGANWSSFLAAYESGPVGLLAGKYTLLLPGAADSTNSPGGNSTAPLTLSTSGRLSGLGTLGDGTPLKILATVAPGGQTPFYNPLYGGAGSFFGWMVFADTANSDITGTLYWTKPATGGSALYPGGFSNTLSVVGSRYVAPPPLTPALNLTNGTVVLTGGNLGSLTIPVTLGGGNKITGSNGLTLTISPVTGAVTGSFLDPVTSAKRTVKGVVLRDLNYGGGTFLGTDQSGALFLGNGP